MNKDEELKQLRQENQELQAANQTLRECVQESIQAIGALHKQVKALEGVIASQQERIKTLEGQMAKDSHLKCAVVLRQWAPCRSVQTDGRRIRAAFDEHFVKKSNPEREEDAVRWLSGLAC